MRANEVGELVLDRLAVLAARAGIREIEEEARSLASRVAEGRFYLACVGQFKRGKSTLLDALVAEEVLPIGILPVTALPTVVRYGPTRSARVLVRGGEWQSVSLSLLASYVSEQQNPHNEKGIVAAEVFLPNDLLATGMCLVDTPGIGSVFQANSASTYAFVPHIDAALVVLGADPPISGEELELVETIASQIEPLLFVLSKVDRVSANELHAAKNFACSVLGSRLDRPIEIYELSAKEKLETGRSTREWDRFEQALKRMLATSGRSLVALAQQRGVARLVAWLRHTIAEEKQALLEPVEASTARAHQLDDYVKRSEQALLDLSHLLLADQQRTFAFLEERRQRFLGGVLPDAHEELAGSIEAAPSSGPRYRRFTTDTAIRIAQNRIFPWLQQEEKAARGEFERLIERFRELSSQFLTSLASAAGDDLVRFAPVVQDWGQFSSRSDFQFQKLLPIARPASPLHYGWDLLMAGLGFRRLITRDAHGFLDWIFEVNTSRVQSDLENRLAVARKEIGVTLRALIARADIVARESLQRARATRDAGHDEVRTRIEFLEMLDSEIAELLASPGRP